MPLPVHDPTKHRDPRIIKARLKMEMAAAEMLYSGKNRTKRDDMMFVNVELLNVIVHITLE